MERQIGFHLLEMNKRKAQLTASEDLILQSKWYIPFNKSFYKSEKVMVDNIRSSMALKRQKVEDSLQDSTSK